MQHILLRLSLLLLSNASVTLYNLYITTYIAMPSQNVSTCGCGRAGSKVCGLDVTFFRTVTDVCARVLCLLSLALRLQIQVENDVNRRKFTGVVPTLRYIWQHEGFRGYFKVGGVVGGEGGTVVEAGGMVGEKEATVVEAGGMIL